MKTMSLQITEEILTILRDRRIYSSISEYSRWKLKDTLTIATDSRVEPYTSFMAGNDIYSMGAFSYSRSSYPATMIKIGRYCSIAKGGEVLGIQHPITRFSSSSVTYDADLVITKKAMEDHQVRDYKTQFYPKKNDGPVIVGNDVWIGQNVSLQRGIIIGDGAIIAANAVVTKDIPPYAIVGGVPAKIIRYRFNEEIRKEMQSIAFWKYPFWEFGEFDMNKDIRYFIDYFYRLLSQGSLNTYAPETLAFECLTVR